MTWASLEEDQGNSVRAEEIRNLYFQQVFHQPYLLSINKQSISVKKPNDCESASCFLQQRTEIVDDASWVMGFLDIIDPAIDSIKRLFNIEKAKEYSAGDDRGEDEQSGGFSTDPASGSTTASGSGFNLDEFIREKLLLDPSKLDVQLGPSRVASSNSAKSAANMRRSENKNVTAVPKL